MQPRAPQPHRGPPALTMMWPISPALPVDPVTISPAQDDAAADPRADEGRDQVAMAPPRAEAELAVAADADVVLHQDRAVEDGGRAPGRAGSS